MYVGMDRSSAELVRDAFDESDDAEIRVESEGNHFGGEAGIRSYVEYSVIVSGAGDCTAIGFIGGNSGIGKEFQEKDLGMEVLCGEEGVDGVRLFSDGFSRDMEEYNEVTRWSDVGKEDLAELIWDSLESVGSVTPDVMWNIVDSYQSIADVQAETKTGFSELENVTWEKAVLIAEFIPGNKYEGEE